jgi:multiple sugar transport system ATP-binding protein
MRVQMRAEFGKLHETTGTTFVYVTHDQVEAMTLADRIVVMKDGEVQQVGDSFEVFERPVNMFVAGFLGSPSMNFLKCQVVSEGAELFLRGGSLNILCPQDIRESLEAYTKKDVVLGIRPEHIYVKETDGSAEPPDIRAEIDISEPTGSNIYLFLLADPYRLVCSVSAKTRLRAHDTVDLQLDRSEMHVFDPETEKTIASTQ